jgi:transposase
MLQALETMGVLEVAGSIPGVSAPQVAAILAETGDPSRFPAAGAMVKHAGLAPGENSSGNHAGQAGISRRGRPTLRLAAWRAVWGALRHNPDRRRQQRRPQRAVRAADRVRHRR